MGKKMGWLFTLAAVLTLIGGIEHLIAGFFGQSLLVYFGTWANWVQGLAGAATAWFVLKKQWGWF